MMNKKGLSFGRLILYILFITILGFIIYSLVLTYKEIKKKEPTKQTISKIEVSPRFVDDNNFAPTNFNAASYFRSCYYVFYNTNDQLLDSYVNLNHKLDEYNTYSLPVYVDYAYDIDINDNIQLVHTESNYYQYFNIEQDSSSSINVGKSIYNSIGFVNSQTIWGQDMDYFSNYGSCAIVFDIDNCPFNYFSCTLNRTNTLWNVHPTIFFVDDEGTMYKKQFYVAPGSDTSFNFGSEIVTSATATGITKMIVFINQKSNSSGLAYYPILNPYNYNNSTNVNYLISNSFNLVMDFETFVTTSEYQEGYNAGYLEGRSNAEEGLVNYNTQLVNENTQLKSNIDSLNSRIAQQQNVIAQLQSQIDNSSNNFRGLFFTMADIPFKTVHSALGFEFWGVNLFEFFVGVLTALGIIWLIKKIL